MKHDRTVVDEPDTSAATRRPGRALHALAAAVALALLWAASLPAVDLVTAAGLGLAVAVVGTAWFVGLVRAVLARGRRPGGPWLAVPAGGLLIAALVVVGAPLQARFAVAEGALSEIAEPLSAAGRGPVGAGDLPAERRIGTYNIERVDVEGRIVFFHVGGDPLFRADDGGFAYVPDGVDVPEDLPYAAGMRHLDANWYRWYGG